ncbi:MAG TPA: hypothetical protein VKE51_39170 [Vicinamibacterales bacterium]|nr:hypothetical protein [Vicinamibacterales bacterium]
MTRTVAVALVVLAGATATMSYAMQASDGGASQGTFTGCVVRIDGDRFVLKTIAPSTRRTGGSSSAKASTPLGGPAASGRQTSGSNSAKSSTPVGATTVSSDGRRTGGATTPKGSVTLVPMSFSATSDLTYALDGDALQLGNYATQMVEISATSSSESSSSARALKVEAVRLLATGCPQ